MKIGGIWNSDGSEIRIAIDAEEGAGVEVYTFVPSAYDEFAKALIALAAMRPGGPWALREGADVEQSAQVH
jgi:hypothetical protein